MWDRDRAKQPFWRLHNATCLVIVAIIEAMAVIGLEATVFAKFFNTDFAREKLGLGIPVYLMIFIFSQVFQVAFAWNAVKQENTIQIIAFAFFNLCGFVYAVFQFKQMNRVLLAHTDPSQANLADALNRVIQQLLIATAVVIGVCELLYLYLGARLYQEFGWRIYKKIGADPEMRRMYRWYQIFVMILKLDIFFFLGYSIQYLILVLTSGDIEYPLTIVALPLTCLVLILAVYAVRHESRQLMLLFFVGCAAGVVYFIFKIYRIYDPSRKDTYLYVKDFLTFFASVTLVLLVLTVANASVCWYHFGKGLKTRLLRDRQMVTVSQSDGMDRSLALD